MSAGRETGSSHHRGEALKLGARGLFQAIERAPKTTNHAIRNRVPWRRLHVNHLTQLTIEKSVLNIKLRHIPVPNRGHGKKSAHSGHMSHGGKSLIIITALLLLEATIHKTRFVVLKRSIRASLNLIDLLACNGTNTGRRRDKIPGASALKRSNLLSHGKLPFGIMLSIPISSRLKGNRKTIVTRREAIRGTMMASRERRSHLVKGRRHIRRRRRRRRRRRGGGRRRRRNIRGSIRNMRASRIVERKRRQRRDGWRVGRERRGTRW
jgi:hypothetical protein